MGRCACALAAVLAAMPLAAWADLSLDEMSGRDGGLDAPAFPAGPPPEPPPAEAYSIVLPAAPALSPEEQLLQDRCTACHPAANWEDKTYSWLRWRMVVLRMEWVNGAEIADGERDVVIATLTRAKPPNAADLARDYAFAAIGAGALVTAIFWIGGKLRRPTTTHRPTRRRRRPW